MAVNQSHKLCTKMRKCAMQAHHVKYESRIQKKKSHPHRKSFNLKKIHGTYFTTVKKNFSLLCCDFMESKACTARITKLIQ